MTAGRPMPTPDDVLGYFDTLSTAAWPLCGEPGTLERMVMVTDRAVSPPSATFCTALFVAAVSSSVSTLLPASVVIRTRAIRRFCA